MKKGKKSILTVILTLILAVAGGVVYDNENEAPQEPAQETVILQESQSASAIEQQEIEMPEVEQQEAEQSEVVQPEVIWESEEEIEFADSEEIEFAVEEEEELTFRKKSNLTSHYEKHGIEMGFDSAEEYLEAANAVVNNPDSLHKLEAEDGDDVYYLEATNEFVVVSKDGYIRTYFNPSGGLDYFNRQ